MHYIPAHHGFNPSLYVSNAAQQENEETHLGSHCEADLGTTTPPSTGKRSTGSDGSGAQHHHSSVDDYSEPWLLSDAFMEPTSLLFSTLNPLSSDGVEINKRSGASTVIFGEEDGGIQTGGTSACGKSDTATSGTELANMMLSTYGVDYAAAFSDDVGVTTASTHTTASASPVQATFSVTGSSNIRSASSDNNSAPSFSVTSPKTFLSSPSVGPQPVAVSGSSENRAFLFAQVASAAQWPQSANVSPADRLKKQQVGGDMPNSWTSSRSAPQSYSVPTDHVDRGIGAAAGTGVQPVLHDYRPQIGGDRLRVASGFHVDELSEGGGSGMGSYRYPNANPRINGVQRMGGSFPSHIPPRVGPIPTPFSVSNGILNGMVGQTAGHHVPLPGGRVGVPNRQPRIRSSVPTPVPTQLYRGQDVHSMSYGMQPHPQQLPQSSRLQHNDPTIGFPKRQAMTATAAVPSTGELLAARLTALRHGHTDRVETDRSECQTHAITHSVSTESSELNPASYASATNGSPLTPIKALPSTIDLSNMPEDVCRHFLTGRCNRRKCRFLHLTPEELSARTRQESESTLTFSTACNGGIGACELPKEILVDSRHD